MITTNPTSQETVPKTKQITQVTQLTQDEPTETKQLQPTTPNPPQPKPTINENQEPCTPSTTTKEKMLTLP